MHSYGERHVILLVTSQTGAASGMKKLLVFDMSSKEKISSSAFVADINQKVQTRPFLFFLLAM